MIGMMPQCCTSQIQLVDASVRKDEVQINDHVNIFAIGKRKLQEKMVFYSIADNT